MIKIVKKYLTWKNNDHNNGVKPFYIIYFELRKILTLILSQTSKPLYSHFTNKYLFPLFLKILSTQQRRRSKCVALTDDYIKRAEMSPQCKNMIKLRI